MEDKSAVTMNPWAAVFRVFWAPGPTMAMVAERRPILPPYLVAALLMSCVMYFVSVATVDMQISIAQQAIAASGQDTEELASQLEMSKQFTPIGSAVTGLIWPWAVGAVGALMMSLFGVFTGSARGFRTYFSVYGYALLPGFLGRMIETLLQLPATGLEDLRRITLSVGALLPSLATGSTGWLLALTVHPTGLWTIALAMIGFAAVHGIAMRKTVGLGIALWLLSFASIWALNLSFGP